MLENYKEKMKILSRRKLVVSTSIAYEVVGAMNILLSLLTNRISAAAILMNIFALKNILSAYIDVSDDLRKMKYIDEHQDEYENLKKLYDEYIDQIVEVLKEVEYDNLLELCISLDILLANGVFSSNRDYEYKSYEENNEYFNELIGAFVTTGTGVCRHNVFFIDDILSKLGVNTVKILCSSKNKRNPNHIILGIIDGDNIFGYDFTMHTPINIENDKLTIPFAKEKLVLCEVKMDKDEFKRLRPAFIPSELFFITVIVSKTKTFELYESLLELNENNSEKLEEISSKTLSLMPRSKEEKKTK